MNRKTQEEAKILGENENLVRIMTIHKSKGLEFPVVFVVGLGRKWNTKDLDRRILLHGKLGIFRNLRKLKKTDVELHLVDVIPAEELNGKNTVEIGDRVYEMMIADMGEEFRYIEE